MCTDSRDAILVVCTVEPANQVTGTAIDCASYTAFTFRDIKRKRRTAFNLFITGYYKLGQVLKLTLRQAV